MRSSFTNYLTVSEQGLTNRWESRQRLIDSIGPHYRTQLFAARDRAREELRDLDKEQLEAIAAEGARLRARLTRRARASRSP
jgi:hypothetical protein